MEINSYFYPFIIDSFNLSMIVHIILILRICVEWLFSSSSRTCRSADRAEVFGLSRSGYQQLLD